jgi:MFS family permease
MAIGWWTGAGSITIAASAIVGGLLIGVSIRRRGIFLVNLPVGLLGALLTLRIDGTAREGGPRGFDPLGQTLAIVALAAIRRLTDRGRAAGTHQRRRPGIGRARRPRRHLHSGRGEKPRADAPARALPQCLLQLGRRLRCHRQPHL